MRAFFGAEPVFQRVTALPTSFLVEFLYSEADLVFELVRLARDCCWRFLRGMFRKMKYTWSMESKTEDPLEVGKILVDLCTGDKYKILAVAKPRDRTKLPVLPTLASRKVHRRGDRSATQRRRLYSYGRVQTFHGRSVGTDCVLEAPDVYPLGPQSRGNSGKGSG